jgi:hypothetical protein
MSRRTSLRVGAASLAVATLLGATGCAGWGGDPEGAITRGAEGRQAARKEVEIRTPRGAVRGVLHPAEGTRGAAVLVSGAGGGLSGPSGVYIELAGRLRGELSRSLYARAGEPKKLVLYPGDGHSIVRHRSQMLERLHGWSKSLLLNGGDA